jgi:hypothetical protein
MERLDNGTARVGGAVSFCFCCCLLLFKCICHHLLLVFARLPYEQQNLWAA